MYVKMISICTAFLLAFSCMSVLASGNSETVNVQATVKFFDKDGVELKSDLESDASATEKMTDNNATTQYRSERGVQSGEIVLDLQSSKNINRVFIEEIATVITSFELLLSSDGKTWRTVYSGKTIGGYGRTFSFPTSSARYVKLNIISTDNEYGDATITLREFQAYNDQSLMKDDLENALYLARIKADFIQKDVICNHYSDEDRAQLESLIQEAEAALESSSQDEIDQITHAIDDELLYLSEKVVPDDRDYEALYWKYFESLVGNNLEYNEERQKTIETLEQTVDQYWPLLLTNPTQQLFKEYNARDSEGMVPVYLSLGRIKNFAIAYKQEHNKYYQNEELLTDILDAIRFVIDEKYSTDITRYGNWYEWMISVPRELADLLILLDKDMPEDMKEKIQTEILFWTGGERYYEVWSGGNRTYVCNVYMKLAISTRNERYFHGIIFSLQDQNVYVETRSEEGFLYDGTFSAHIGHVYNTGYGLDLFNNSYNFINLLQDSIWQVDQSLIDDFADKILLGMEPILVNGVATDIVSGRNIGAGVYYGQTISEMIGKMGELSAEPYRSMFMALAKECALKTGTTNKFSTDDSIVERGPVINFKRLVMGDKVVYHNDGWGFGLGMYSNRIRNFERESGQARKAWYCNSGALYLMNNDISEYDNAWWTAVNHYHLPGTTVDMVERGTDQFEGEGYSPYSWVSSMDLDEKYGCAGYTNYNYFSSLTSLKSYFVFDDEVVCVGSDISGGTNHIETTIANQRMRDDNSNELYINGDKVTEQQLTDVEADTIYLEGNVEGDSYGYYFPDGQTVQYLNSYRSGEATDFNINYTPGIVEDYFTEIWIDHGEQPDKDTYSYVVIPNQTQDYLNQYAANPDIEILQQDSNAHIVTDKKLGITGYNIWAEENNVTSDGIKTSAPVIMMTRENSSQYEISLTDPTQEQNGTIEIEFPQNVESIMECSENITVLDTKPLKISVKAADIEGRKLTLLASKTAYGFDANLTANAIYCHVNGDVALICNRLNGDFVPVVRGENVYLPFEAVANAFGDRFHYSESANAYQLITDSDLLTIQDDGRILLNGDDTVYSYRTNGIGDVIVEGETTYASLDLLNDVYHTKSYWDGENLIFRIDSDVQQNALDALRNYIQAAELPTQSAKMPFEDVAADHWAYSPIQYLYEHGIVNGESDNAFCPDNNVTREEFVKILVHALNISGVDSTTAFRDVDENEWYCKDIQTAYSTGIVTGLSTDTFGIGQNITREDICVMLARALDYQGKDITASGGKEYVDTDEISDYAREAVALMTDAGILSGYEDGTVQPKAFATRAECAKLMYTLLDALGQIR